MNGNDTDIEIVEHEVEIDDNISATLKIPKKMTAIDLKSLMLKANKMFNLAEVPIMAKRNGYAKRNYANQWTPEHSKQFLKDYDNASHGDKEALVAKYGFSSLNSLQSRLYKVRAMLGVKSERKESAGIIFSPELKEQIKQKYNSGIKGKEIAEQMGFKTSQIYDKLQQMKKVGEII